MSSQNKLLLGLGVVYLTGLFLYFSFFIWAETLVCFSALTLVLWVILYDGIRPWLPYHGKTEVVRERMNALWANGIGVARIGFIAAFTFLCLRWSGHSKLMVVAFLWLALLVLAMIVVRVGFDRRLPRVYVVRIVVLFMAVSMALQISELTLVRWQYRHYPAFVQTYECYQLDPQNPLLRDQVKLEHMRIVLDAEAFKSYELQHRSTIQHPNQW